MVPWSDFSPLIKVCEAKLIITFLGV